MHFKMSSAICFNLDQSKILSSGSNGLILNDTISDMKELLDKKLIRHIAHARDCLS